MAKKETKQKALFRCEWRDVVALNFEIDPRILRPHLPPGTQVDSYNEHTLVTLMAKNIREFQPGGGSFTLFRSVNEIDIRSYAKIELDGQIYRGHFKLRNFVSSKIACRVLKWLTKQKQEFVSTQRNTIGFEEARRDALPSADYRWKFQGIENHFMVKARKAARKGMEDSKEQFVLEQRNRFVATSKGTIRHPIRRTPWLVWNASSGSFDCDARNLVDETFRKYLSRPSFVLLSRGGEVTVSKGQKTS